MRTRTIVEPSLIQDAATRAARFLALLPERRVGAEPAAVDRLERFLAEPLGTDPIDGCSGDSMIEIPAGSMPLTMLLRPEAMSREVFGRSLRYR